MTAPQQAPSLRWRRADTVIARRVAGEVVLVPLSARASDPEFKGARLYVLNETGEFLWSLLDSPRSSHDLAQNLTLEFEISAGRAQSDASGYYKFVTIKPGAYPWGNHHNAWRPAHIHFSVFGHSFVSRLVTQMYFPNDPLFEFDPIFNSVPDEKARYRMVSAFDLENTQPEWALCYRFNIVLRGKSATPMETK